MRWWISLMADSGCCRHQVFDVPELRFSVIEHPLFSGYCDNCGGYHAAHTPDSLPSGQMVPNLVALIAHLSGRYHLTIRQIGDYVRSQPVAHADETRHFRRTGCRWLWALVTLKASYFLVHHSRGNASNTP